jgi:aryl sulfotransferase
MSSEQADRSSAYAPTHSKPDPRRLPKRTSRYRGRFSNTDRWDAFRPRCDDLFICTPPKCGTTWTQAICAFLILGTDELYDSLLNISPWFDSEFEPLDRCVETLDAQDHRRFVKTHTPLDGIPFFESSTYFVVYRNPIDTYFSSRHHRLNLRERPESAHLDPDPRVGFRAWIEDPFKPGVGEQQSLQGYAHHFRTFRDYSHLDSIHFFHYSDMKRDLPSVIRRMAEALGLPVSPDRVAAICELVSFAEMKRQSSVFSPGAGKSVFTSDDAFFRSGTNDQSVGVLTPDDIALYEERVTDLLTSAERLWVEQGGTFPS